MDITALLASPGKATPLSGGDAKPTAPLTDREFSLRLDQAAEQARTIGKNAPPRAPDTATGDAAARPTSPHGKEALVSALAPLPQGIARASATLSPATTSQQWLAAVHGIGSTPQSAEPLRAELADQEELLADALLPLDGELGDLQRLASIRERLDLIDNAGQLSQAVAAMASAAVPGQGQSTATLPASSASAGETLELGGLVANPRSGITPQALVAESGPQQRFDSLASELKAVPPQGAASQALTSPPAQPLAAPSPVAATLHEAGFASRLGQRGDASSTGGMDMSSTAGVHSQSLHQPNATQGATGMPSNTLYTATLSAPVASPQWQQHLGQQLVGLHQRGGQQIDLHLNPAELGPLSVSLKMGEQGAQVHFLSAHAQVRSAVEQAIPQLREALEEQGISLGDTMVGEHAQHQQQDQPAFAGGSPSSGGDSGDGAMTGEIGNAATPAAGSGSLDGRVDLYA
ncbi:flagellar hook-length control protein FliK [Litchfieldella rifensis]|uniref:Flagellar hook-length control protein FliK n=1 Tax=Litchfieldella rifensis TaxID=762643 RepID=A0ABV7LSD8_9GAMM